MDKKYISVFALNKYIKAKFNQDISLQSLYIKGEISNYRPHPSGHIYFTLKDENSRINAVMFASYAKALDFDIINGLQVLIKASVSVYEPTGQYQLYVENMKKDGVGSLYQKYNELKEKLHKEGLFDQSHKKKIPEYPKTIAILSAKQGAALQDILKTIRLRFPVVKVIVFPIPVQGIGAYTRIIEILNNVDKIGFDTIIIARGGGSIEDLWNFNEEALARCIYQCHTPIISGVGHETDFTICDFVSDYRAATPTAAAIKATPDAKHMNEYNMHLKNKLIFLMNNKIDSCQLQLNHLKNNYILNNPDFIYSNESLRLIHLNDRFIHFYQTFKDNEMMKIKKYEELMFNHINKKIEHVYYDLNHNITKLDALSPLKVIQRGFVLVHKDHHIIKSSKQLNENDEVELKFYDGIKKAIVK